MEKNWIKAMNAYNRLNEDEKLSFRLMIDPDTKDLEQEFRELDKLNMRINIASNFLNLRNDMGKPYISIEWILKDILKLSDEQIKECLLFENDCKKSI